MDAMKLSNELLRFANFIMDKFGKLGMLTGWSTRRSGARHVRWVAPAKRPPAFARVPMELLGFDRVIRSATRPDLCRR